MRGARIRVHAWYHARAQLSTGVGDAPNGPGSVVRYHQRPISGGGDTDGAPPYISVRQHETGQEVLVDAGGFTVRERDPDDFVAGPDGLIPGAVLGSKDVALIFGGEHL